MIFIYKYTRNPIKRYIWFFDELMYWKQAKISVFYLKKFDGAISVQ